MPPTMVTTRPTVLERKLWSPSAGDDANGRREGCEGRGESGSSGERRGESGCEGGSGGRAGRRLGAGGRIGGLNIGQRKGTGSLVAAINIWTGSIPGGGSRRMVQSEEEGEVKRSSGTSSTISTCQHGQGLRHAKPTMGKQSSVGEGVCRIAKPSRARCRRDHGYLIRIHKKNEGRGERGKEEEGEIFGWRSARPGARAREGESERRSEGESEGVSAGVSEGVSEGGSEGESAGVSEGKRGQRAENREGEAKERKTGRKRVSDTGRETTKNLGYATASLEVTTDAATTDTTITWAAKSAELTLAAAARLKRTSETRAGERSASTVSSNLVVRGAKGSGGNNGGGSSGRGSKCGEGMVGGARGVVSGESGAGG